MYYMFIFNRRYQPSEPINVTVEPGEPTIVNFTLKQDTFDDQGNQDIMVVRLYP